VNLRTARLRFGEWTVADIDRARKLWGDVDVTRFIGGPFSEEQIETRLAKEVAYAAEHGIQYWPLFAVSGDDLVGCCGLRPYRDGIYELGVHIRPKFWRQGYGEEAARAVIRHAFDDLGVNTLFAGHHPANEPSRRLLEKLGFRYTHRERYEPTGLDHLSYMLFVR
jgi:RimJ/RimL family protein N-acetyltransferase